MCEGSPSCFTARAPCWTAPAAPCVLPALPCASSPGARLAAAAAAFDNCRAPSALRTAPFAFRCAQGDDGEEFLRIVRAVVAETGSQQSVASQAAQRPGGSLDLEVLESLTNTLRSEDGISCCATCAPPLAALLFPPSRVSKALVERFAQWRKLLASARLVNAPVAAALHR